MPSSCISVTGLDSLRLVETESHSSGYELESQEVGSASAQLMFTILKKILG